MKFDKSQNSSWNALVVYVNSQCILVGSKPQKIFVCAFCLKFELLLLIDQNCNLIIY